MVQCGSNTLPLSPSNGDRTTTHRGKSTQSKMCENARCQHAWCRTRQTHTRKSIPDWCVCCQPVGSPSHCLSLGVCAVAGGWQWVAGGEKRADSWATPRHDVSPRHTARWLVQWGNVCSRYSSCPKHTVSGWVEWQNVVFLAPPAPPSPAKTENNTSMYSFSSCL